MLTFAFMLSSLPCLCTFWHAISAYTSFYNFHVFISSFLMLISVTVTPKPKKIFFQV